MSTYFAYKHQLCSQVSYIPAQVLKTYNLNYKKQYTILSFSKDLTLIQTKVTI